MKKNKGLIYKKNLIKRKNKNNKKWEKYVEKKNLTKIHLTI